MRLKSKSVFKRLSIQLMLLILFANVVAGANICNLNWLWYFQNVVTDNDVLNLEASNTGQIVLQPSNPYESNSSQLFSVECASKPGLFYIVHTATGKVLDVERETSSHQVILAGTQDNSLWQQWFLDYRNLRVTNAASQFVLTVENDNFVAGATVVLEPLAEVRTPSQLWIWADVDVK